LLMLVALAYPYDFLGVAIYDLVVPKMFFLRLAAVAFFISLAFRLAFEPRGIGRFFGSTWPILAWLGWQAASFAWTDYTWATTEAVIDNACIVACALGMVMFFTGCAARKFGAAAFALTAALACAIFLFGSGKQPFVNVNPGGMFLALAAVAGAGWFFNSSNTRTKGVRPLLLLFVGVCVAGVVRSDSVGAAIALGIGAVVLVVVAWKERLIALTAALVLMGAFLAAILAAPALKDEILGPKYYSTTWTRVFFWRGALGMIYERPVLGRGAGSFAVANAQYQPVESYMHDGIKSASPYAHNYYIETAAETGVTGVAIFLGVAVFALARARKAMAALPDKRWQIAGLVGACAVAMAHGGVDIVMSLPTTRIFFWMCVAAILGAAQREKPEAGKGGGARWAAALVPAACAIVAWLIFFRGELPREIDYTRAINLYESAISTAGAPDTDKLREAERLLGRANEAPYATRISLFMLAVRGRALTHEALALDEKFRHANEWGWKTPWETSKRYLEEAAAEFRGLNALAPGLYKVDMHLGFALINLGTESDVAEGCRLLVEHMRLNPFNVPEKTEASLETKAIFGPAAAVKEYSENTAGIVNALEQNLQDPALKRELVEILASALTLVADGGPDVPDGVKAAAAALAEYQEKLGHDPDLATQP